MGVAENLEGHALAGKKRKWKILKRMEGTEKNTGGSFSVAYLAQSTSDSQKAFIKATDFELMTNGQDDSLVRWLATLQRFVTEKEILEKCLGNRMDRIVAPLDFGQSLLTSDKGVQQPVVWLAQELADTDARIQRAKISSYDFDWTAKAMHNLATGVQQLHSAGISHNNIKPSALLLFEQLLQKLGDLACATSPDVVCIHDNKACIGDPRYAAPELTYGAPSYKIVNARQMNDLFLLGSVGFFLVTNSMLWPTMASFMSDEHRPFDEGGGWGDGFENALPYIREGHRKAMEMLADTMPSDFRVKGKDYAIDYVNAIAQLTDPDPNLRGHPEDRVRGKNSVERYVSLFDRLSNVAKLVQ